MPIPTQNVILPASSDQNSEGISSMVVPAPVATQERPGEHRETPRRHEDDGGLRHNAGTPDLGGELGHLPWDQGRGDAAPLELLDMEQAGRRRRRNRLTVQRHRRQPPPPRPCGGAVVPELQPLVLEQGAADATTDTGASVLEEAHHGSSFTAKAARKEI